MKYLVIISLLVLSVSAFSSQKHGKGKIERISAYVSGSERYGTIDVQGFDRSGVNCYQSGATNLVTFSIEDSNFGNSQYSLAMAAYMSDLKVRVKADDTHKQGNYCILELIQICKNDSSCT